MQQASKLELFLSSSQISNICKDLAKKINSDYQEFVADTPDKFTEPSLVAISILKGSLFFIADIMREVKIPFIIDFVKLSSYGKSTKSAGTVTILQDISTNIRGKHVIVFDEIIDSGTTLSFYIDRLLAAQPASIKLCALIDKKGCRCASNNIEVDYAGITSSDEFLVGYGLDYAEQYRNLPNIYKLIF